jgi:hypothetical protein
MYETNAGTNMTAAEATENILWTIRELARGEKDVSEAMSELDVLVNEFDGADDTSVSLYEMGELHRMVDSLPGTVGEFIETLESWQNGEIDHGEAACTLWLLVDEMGDYLDETDVSGDM